MLTQSTRSTMCALVGATLLIPALTVPAATAAPGRPGGSPLISVTATAETPAVFNDKEGGKSNSDDPAIWVDRVDPARSIVLGTLKSDGMNVFDLTGRVLQHVAPPATDRPTNDEPSRFNNVSIVRDFRLGGRTVDLAVVSDRGRDQIRSYVIDPATRSVRDVTAPAVPFVFATDQAEVNKQETAYGLATYRSGGHSYAVVSQRNRAGVAIVELVADSSGTVGYRTVDTIAFPTQFTLPDGTAWTPCEEPGADAQIEGLVVDEDTHSLYAAQEDIGVWRVPLRGGRAAGAPRSVERTKEFGVPATYDEADESCTVTGADPGFGGRIAADTEGLTIYRTGPRSGSLLVSSQGDDTFYTYDRVANRPLRHFAVVDSERADGVSHCDGADTVSTPLPGYPHGLLVVQDGTNTPDEVGSDGSVRANTNFKFLDAAVLGR